MLELTKAEPPTTAEPYKASNSSIALFQSCQKKFYYRYILGIEGKQFPDDKLQFGSAVHKALELNANKRVADWSVRAACEGLDADLSALVAGTVAAYSVYWAKSLRYQCVESKFETELRNSRLTLVTIVDGLAETDSGELAVVDHKTTESDIRPGAWFWERLQLDRQVSAYVWASRVHGKPVEYALWDAIKRPNLRRRSEAIPAERYVKSGKWGRAGDVKPGTGLEAESPAEFAKRVTDTILAEPEAYFQRAPVQRLDGELDGALDEIEAIGAQILACWDLDSWPRNPQGCFSYGKRCEYFEACTGAANPADETLYQLRKSR